MEAELRFEAMGGHVHAIVVGSAADPAYAERRIRELDELWSDDVTRLNRGAGTPVSVSPETIELVQRSLEGWRLTVGVFDPTVVGSVVDEGPMPVGLLSQGCDRIAIGAGLVTLPAGVGFDPGGISGGLAADIVCHELRELGADGACINVCGAVRAEGAPPAGGAWTIAIQHPGRAEEIALVGMRGGAVATTTSLLRSWRADGHAPANHIELTSVIARSCWHAQVLAKTLIVSPLDDPFRTIEATGAEALISTADHQMLRSRGFHRYVPELEPGLP